MENSGKKNFIFIQMFIWILSSGFINRSILLKIIGCGYLNLIQITDLSRLSKNRIGSLTLSLKVIRVPNRSDWVKSGQNFASILKYYLYSNSNFYNTFNCIIYIMQVNAGQCGSFRVAYSEL
jgi:hypothetical protein